MVTKRKSTKPAASPDREQRLLELQQTLAEAQRNLGQALIALSSGQALGVWPAARTVSTDTQFMHSGELMFDDGRLFFEDNGETFLLTELADCGKTISLEFELSQVLVTSRGAGANKFDALATFLVERAANVTMTKATCGFGSPPPPHQPLHQPSVPRPSAPPRPRKSKSAAKS